VLRPRLRIVAAGAPELPQVLRAYPEDLVEVGEVLPLGSHEAVEIVDPVLLNLDVFGDVLEALVG
jgi:hypothetical protein